MTQSAPPLERTSEPAPDAELVARIVREHQARVQRVLRQKGVAERDVADAAQDVFVVVHRKLASFEARSSLGTWLHRIACNVASEYRRRARHRYELLTEAPDTERASDDPCAQLEARDALHRVERALGALSAEQREALLLHEVGGLSARELAAQLGVPLKTAFSRVYAARRVLLARVAARGPKAAVCALLWTWQAWWRTARAQAQLAGVALACSVVVMQGAAGSPSSVRVAANEATRVQRALAAAPVRAATAMRELHGEQGSAAKLTREREHERERERPREQAPERMESREARVAPRAAASRAPRTQASIEPALSPAAPTPEPQRTHTTHELRVTRMSAQELGASLEHPLAQRIAPSAPAELRVARRSDASGSLDDRLRDARLP